MPLEAETPEREVQRLLVGPAGEAVARMLALLLTLDPAVCLRAPCRAGQAPEK